MNTRKELHAALVEALGSNNVYFQPPATIKMKYPAIVYTVNNFENRHANNNPYLSNTFYKVLVISPDPEDPAVNKVLNIPRAKPGHRYVMENLYHDSFTFYI